MKDDIIFAIALVVCMFISSLIYVFFVLPDDDEFRYYQEKGIKMPFERLKKSEARFYPLLVLFALMPYWFTSIIMLIFFDIEGWTWSTSKGTEAAVILLFAPECLISDAIYEAFKKRGKIKYKKFKFEDETDDSDNKNS